MAQSAYIKFVEGSEVAALTLEQVKEQLSVYREQMSKTGTQVSWDYADAAFPYTIETRPDNDNRWFYLKGTDPAYKYIMFGVGSEQRPGGEDEQPQEVHYIQVVLPEGCTHGDKAKGNELCKFIARRLKAELHLFNGRVMYFNPRK